MNQYICFSFDTYTNTCTCCCNFRCSFHIRFGRGCRTLNYTVCGVLFIYFYKEVPLIAENCPHDTLKRCKVQASWYIVDSKWEILIIKVINRRQLCMGVDRAVDPPQGSKIAALICTFKTNRFSFFDCLIPWLKYKWNSTFCDIVYTMKTRILIKLYSSSWHFNTSYLIYIGAYYLQHCPVATYYAGLHDGLTPCLAY